MTTQRQRAIAKALTDLLPQITFADSEPIRKDALKAHLRDVTATSALWLATIAYIRHQYTDYDALRDEGYDKDSARFFVLDAINEKLTQWGCQRFLTSEETDQSIDKHFKTIG